jgi:hypothetical protein
MIIQAKGQLQHHFWGEYCASIYLQFHSEDLALQAQALAFPNWKHKGSVLGFHGTGAALKAEEATLVAHGADRKKISSLKYSIDRGEVFTVNVDLTPAPVEVQLSLLEGAL